MMGSATASCSCLLLASASAAAFSAQVGGYGSCRLERKVKSPAGSLRCVRNDGGNIRHNTGGKRWDSDCHGDAVLRNDQSSECVSLRSEKTADCVSKGGMAFLLASSLSYAICDNVLAAGEAVPVPGDNTNLMFIIACVAEALALTGAVVGECQIYRLQFSPYRKKMLLCIWRRFCLQKADGGKMPTCTKFLVDRTGVLARQRKEELEKINAQLRQINVNLRRQSRVESYAPNLTYAPVGGGRMADTQTREDPVREELMTHLKAGKRWLREQNPVSAFKEFEIALPLAQKLKDTVEEKKAARGLGASCQRQGKYREAIKYHTIVLNISHMTREHSGNTEAYGAIADCYTELGDLETAARFYDKYIAGLEQDD